MKAAIHRGKDKIQIEEVAVPGVPPHHVLIDTKVTGICGSDLHRYHGN
jgi:L-iditol 2-dehydrogenase